MNVDVESSGRYKHFGHLIHGGTRGGDDSFTKCRSCGTRLWKDELMSTIHCESCGLIQRLEHGDSKIKGASSGRSSGANGRESDFRRIDLNHPPRYDGSDRVRMFGGYFSAYVGDGEYEFGQLKDGGLLDNR